MTFFISMFLEPLLRYLSLYKADPFQSRFLKSATLTLLKRPFPLMILLNMPSIFEMRTSLSPPVLFLFQAVE
jgi:hypothetical protein